MKITKMNLRISLFFSSFIFFWGFASFSQVPPAGKYDTTSYIDDRKAINELTRNINFIDTSVYHADDYIAVGPDGKISYGFSEWKKGFTDRGMKFKSAIPVPGSTVLRVYNGDAAVKNSVVNIVFDTPNGDMKITVARTETFVKISGKWFFVAGQGTRVISREEMDENMKKSIKN